MNLNIYKVRIDSSIRDAVKVMDENGSFFCVCVDDKEKVIGVVSDGDFRRAVHNGIQLDENVSKIVNKKFIYLSKNYSQKEVEAIFNETIIEVVPILEDGRLIDIILVKNFRGIDGEMKKRVLDNSVVIMAGGKGTRLDPITRILPKPLIPLGDDPVIKVIMDEFFKFGVGDFYISLGNEGKMIKAYFHEHDLRYQVKYIHEGKPLGTAGSLKSLEGIVKKAFFVSNCDTIVRTDYGALYDFHKGGGHALTMVGSMRQYNIPYGVCETDQAGLLRSIKEKPHYDLLVSTGMYLLEPEIIKYIPEGETFNMTDLIQKVQKKSLKIGIFPVSEKSWTDVGQLLEYKNVVNQLAW